MCLSSSWMIRGMPFAFQASWIGPYIPSYQHCHVISPDAVSSMSVSIWTSRLTPNMTNGRPRYFSTRFSSMGCRATQRPHQSAEKINKTTLSLYSLRRKSLPSASVPSISGAGLPGTMLFSSNAKARDRSPYDLAFEEGSQLDEYFPGTGSLPICCWHVGIFIGSETKKPIDFGRPPVPPDATLGGFSAVPLRSKDMGRPAQHNTPINVQCSRPGPQTHSAHTVLRPTHWHTMPEAHFVALCAVRFRFNKPMKNFSVPAIYVQ